MWTYQNGNTTVLILDDGTKIRTIPDDTPVDIIRPESIDVKITNYCDLGCAFCHESSTIEGIHGDLGLLFTTLSNIDLNGTELAIGGGNPLSHPDLVPFLMKLRYSGAIPNLTINQGHVGKYFELITYLISEKLVYGLGISITSNQYKFIDELMAMSDNNVVFHIIAGIHEPEIIPFLLDRYGKVKVLLLGYKDWGFGVKYRDDKVDRLITKWYNRIGSIINMKGLVMSFDNLGIEQMDLKRWFIGDTWNKFYMGDDFTYTMYIDGVNGEYAPTSRSSTRVSFNDMSFSDYFNTYKNTGI